MSEEQALYAQEKIAHIKKQVGETVAQQKIDDIKAVCGLPQGRRLIWELLDFCGVYGMSFVAGNGDVTAFNEGRRAVGLKLLNRVNNASKSLLNQIILEHYSVVESNKAIKNKILEGEDE
jgi:hypothetical protein